MNVDAKDKEDIEIGISKNRTEEEFKWIRLD